MSTFLDRLFGKKAKRALPAPRKRTILQLEALETRLMPAFTFTAMALTYQDVDGDTATVKFSKPLLNAGNVNNVFTFSLANAAGGQQLQRINLGAIGPAAGGLSIKVTATSSAALGGDGFANVGFISGGGIDLGPVEVKGDLGGINAGDSNSATQGLGALTVQSLGRFGLSTQALGGSLVSNIEGKLASLTVKSDIVGAHVQVFGAGAANNAHGQIGKLTVGGSLFGTPLGRGSVFASGAIGAVVVKGDLIGGEMDDSAKISSLGKIASVTVGGSLVGSVGKKSGAIFSTGNMGLVTIKGSVVGGSGEDAGQINSGANLAGVSLDGSLIGGSKRGAGLIFSQSDMGAVNIKGDVRGGSKVQTGTVLSFGKLAAATVGGSLLGGSGDLSGVVVSKKAMGAVNITGSVVGGDAPSADLDSSGYIEGERIASVFIGGSVIAGHNVDPISYLLKRSGSIRAKDDLGPITVQGSLVGNSTNPVIVSARGQAVHSSTSDLAIASLTVGGRVEFADILAGYDVDLIPGNADAQIGAVKVALDWIASNLVAGVMDGGDGFGNNNDTLIAGGTDLATIIAKIASVDIGGQALGTIADANVPDTLTDLYGFVAQQVVKFKVGGTSLALNSGASNDGPLPIGTTGDLALFEVPS